MRTCRSASHSIPRTPHDLRIIEVNEGRSEGSEVVFCDSDGLDVAMNQPTQVFVSGDPEPAGARVNRGDLLIAEVTNKYVCHNSTSGAITCYQITGAADTQLNPVGTRVNR